MTQFFYFSSYDEKGDLNLKIKNKVCASIIVTREIEIEIKIQRVVHPVFQIV